MTNRDFDADGVSLDNPKLAYTRVFSSDNEKAWWVSTGYRESSAMTVDPAPKYFETIVWTVDDDGDDFRDEMIHQEDSGSYQETALDRHAEIVKELRKMGDVSHE